MKYQPTLGSEIIASFKMQGCYTKTDLFRKMQDEVAMYIAKDDDGLKRINRFDRFYLKILGDVPESFLKKEERGCKGCAYNESNRQFDDYNELRDEKVEALVLSSTYKDFEIFDVVCAYFTDKPEKDFDNVIVMGSKDGAVSHHFRNTMKKLFHLKDEK